MECLECRNREHRKSTIGSPDSPVGFSLCLAPSYRSGSTRTKKRPRRTLSGAAQNPKRSSEVFPSVRASETCLRWGSGIECCDEFLVH
jgi:hypothetical protein